MNPRKHKRKESFSILLVSNTGQNSKQFHIARSFIRLFTVFVIVVCAAFGWLAYRYVNDYQTGGAGWLVKASSDENSETKEELLEQIAAQEELVKQLEAQKNALAGENDALTTENKALLEAAKVNMGTDKAGGGSGEDGSAPGRYPYSGQGDLSVKYSQEHPYVSIDTQDGGDVIAAGDGTVTAVGSDDTYPLIIEIEHGNHYKTRYLFLQDADALHEEGAQVRAGDALTTLGAQNVQLDYQVIYEGEPIDPLIVFEAKG